MNSQEELTKRIRSIVGRGRPLNGNLLSVMLRNWGPEQTEVLCDPKVRKRLSAGLAELAGDMTFESPRLTPQKIEEFQLDVVDLFVKTLGPAGKPIKLAVSAELKGTTRRVASFQQLVTEVSSNYASICKHLPRGEAFDIDRESVPHSKLSTDALTMESSDGALEVRRDISSIEADIARIERRQEADAIKLAELKADLRHVHLRNLASEVFKDDWLDGDEPTAETLTKKFAAKAGQSLDESKTMKAILKLTQVYRRGGKSYTVRFDGQKCVLDFHSQSSTLQFLTPGRNKSYLGATATWPDIKFEK